MKNRDVIEAIEEAGWVLVRQESTHRQYKKIGVRSIITINGPDRKEISAGLLQLIRRTTGLELRS